MLCRKPAVLDEDDKKTLMGVARASVKCGLEQGMPLPVKDHEFSASLEETAACFVTLKENDQLRGCIGSLEAWRPLVEDCSENAFNAAFRDPRFPPLTEREYGQLDFHISVLSKTSPLQFDSEEDLLKQLRPGVDGLVMEDGGHRGTFLPAVWEDLPAPQEFLNHLKRKAGLPLNYWSDTLRVSRYTVDDIYD